MVYNVLKSKVEMDLAFFLGINLIESINYGKCVLNYPEVIIVRVKSALLWKLSMCMNINLKI